MLRPKPRATISEPRPQPWLTEPELVIGPGTALVLLPLLLAAALPVAAAAVPVCVTSISRFDAQEQEGRDLGHHARAAGVRLEASARQVSRKRRRAA